MHNVSSGSGAPSTIMAGIAGAFRRLGGFGCSTVARGNPGIFRPSRGETCSADTARASWPTCAARARVRPRLPRRGGPPRRAQRRPEHIERPSRGLRLLTARVRERLTTIVPRSSSHPTPTCCSRTTSARRRPCSIVEFTPVAGPARAAEDRATLSSRPSPVEGAPPARFRTTAGRRPAARDAPGRDPRHVEAVAAGHPHPAPDPRGGRAAVFHPTMAPHLPTAAGPSRRDDVPGFSHYPARVSVQGTLVGGARRRPRRKAMRPVGFGPDCAMLPWPVRPGGYRPPGEPAPPSKPGLTSAARRLALRARRTKRRSVLQFEAPARAPGADRQEHRRLHCARR